MKRIGLLVLLLWMGAFASAQSKPAAVAPAPAKIAVDVVPIDKEPSHHLVFENEYVRVFSVEVAPHSETKYHQHDRDYVWVALGDSDVESVRVGEPAVHIQPKDGETQFSKAKFAHKAVNLSDKPFRNVTVELQGRYADLKLCLPVSVDCTRQLTHKDRVIGSVRKLFSWNPNEAWHYELLDKDVTYSTPFTSLHGDFKVLLIPITALELSIDAKTRKLEIGETIWMGGNPEVTVLQGQEKREWIILRFWGPEDH